MPTLAYCDYTTQHLYGDKSLSVAYTVPPLIVPTVAFRLLMIVSAIGHVYFSEPDWATLLALDFRLSLVSSQLYLRNNGLLVLRNNTAITDYPYLPYRTSDILKAPLGLLLTNVALQ